MTAPPQSSGEESYGESQSLPWLAWFGGLKGYYRTMMGYIAGQNPAGIEGTIHRLSGTWVRRGAEQARYVFWATVLHRRDRKFRRGRWSLTELQWEILQNEELNSRFFRDVQSALEQYIESESRRYGRHHGGVQMQRSDLFGATINRGAFVIRNRNYDGYLTNNAASPATP